MRSIRDKLNPCSLPYLPPPEQARVETVSPDSLLTAGRFDLGAKLLYAKAFRDGTGLDWARQIYAEHLRVFNGLSESDASGKNDLKSYESAYQQLLTEIGRDGFDQEMSLVPVNQHGLLLDGAHRTAACIAFNRPITVARFTTKGRTYDYRFFVHRGLSSAAADASAIEYLRHRRNSYMILMYPAAGENLDAAQSILQERGEIAYQKTISLSGDGPVNLIRQVYPEESWLGSYRNGFAGAHRKASACFPNWQGKVTVYLFDAAEGTNMVQLKAEIRERYRVENHSIHTNDTPEEGLYLAQFLFSNNSIWAMNNARFQPFSDFYQQFESYRRKPNQAQRCLGTEALLALVGLRPCNNLDPMDGKNVDADPSTHFFFNGVRFIMPHSALRRSVQYDQETRSLLEGLRDSSLQDAQYERQRKRRQRYYYLLLRARRMLRIDTVYRGFMRLRHCIKAK